MFIQQGDVKIEKMESEIPSDATGYNPIERGFVLRDGEATGHAHVIDPTQIDDKIEMFEKDGILYLKTDKEVTVTHEEHHSQIIPPGIWKIDAVKEYDHFSEESREVID